MGAAPDEPPAVGHHGSGRAGGPTRRLDATDQVGQTGTRQGEETDVVLAQVGPLRGGVREGLGHPRPEAAGGSEVARQADHPDLGLEGRIVETAGPVDHDHHIGRDRDLRHRSATRVTSPASPGRMWVRTTAVTSSRAGPSSAVGRWPADAPGASWCPHGVRLIALEAGVLAWCSACAAAASDSRMGSRDEDGRRRGHPMPGRSAAGPVISVVVPVRNAMPWLEDQLRALVDQECDRGVGGVVADNGSTDESAAVGRAWADRHARGPVDRRVRRRRAPARPVTPGCERPTGDLLAFCDADDVVQPGWLAACVSALATPTWPPGCFDFWSLNGRPAAAPEPAATWQLGFLPAGLGANLAVRREAFEDVGGFAEELVVGRGHRPVLAPPAGGVPFRGGRRRGGGQARATRYGGGVPARNHLRAQRPRPLPPVPGRRGPARPAGGGPIVALVDRPRPAPPHPHRAARPVGPRRGDAHRETPGFTPAPGVLP